MPPSLRGIWSVSADAEPLEVAEGDAVPVGRYPFDWNLMLPGDSVASHPGACPAMPVASR